ncbi:hypothetical protein SAMN05421770_10786 [Granulicella rosea]|uniref:Uncharacterized protein n=1 Tax=Granulicella rosea TaxID=474952 RepID=A0A239LK05_9BACT|nr:hypothetical protein [Granulicella rosea]SNT30801.1 hypothetical protein SAMN05421770_10786 [Granulicella rosea]
MMSRRTILAALLFAPPMLSHALFSQTHRVEKQQAVVRAVGVYEWTGDLAKPDASRLIPVTVYIDSELRDAGVYLARPVPFALETGTIFDLDEAGIVKGTVELSFARHLVPSETASNDATPYDDGWFGYGVYKPLPVIKVKPATKVRQSNASVAVNGQTKPDSDRPSFARKPAADSSAPPTASNSSSNDPDRPTMKRKDDSAASTPAATSSTTTPAASAPADDPDRPTMKRRDDSSAPSTTPAATTTSTPAADPDRPTLTRKTDSTASTTSSSSADDPDRPTMKKRQDTASTTTDTSTPPADDPDRPTLKKRSPAELKQAAKERNQSSSDGIGSLNDDPNRPKIHRGKPAGALSDDDLTKLTGLPQNLHQMVAVSDAVNRPPHNFTLAWDTEQEHAVILGKLQGFAREKVLAYNATVAAAAPPPPPVKPPATAAARRKAALAAKMPPPEMALTDESVKAYTLSYGGAPTYVYTAAAPPGPDGAVRYVAVVAQADALGELKVAMSSVTDALHLDRTPRMRLVDAVDVEASNRASLLMELRAQHSRQFALYRVIGAQSQQIFTTGSTQ